MNGSVECIEGKLGSGKTTLAAEIVLEDLERGAYAFSNIEFYPELITQDFASKGLVFDPLRLVLLRQNVDEWYKVLPRGTAEQTVTVVVDEAHLVGVHSGDWAMVERSLDNLITLARKLDLKFYFISQDVNKIAKQIRMQFQVVTQCRNLRSMKILGVIPMPLPLYARVPYNCAWGKKPERMTPSFTWKSRAWGLFNSDALLGSAADQFAHMKSVHGKPLKRCKRQPPPKLSHHQPLNWLELAVALGTALLTSA